ALDFALDRLLERQPNRTVETSLAILDRILGVMAKSGSWYDITRYDTAVRTKQELTVHLLANRLRLKIETVWARFGELRTEQQRREREQAARSATLPGAEAAESPPPPAPEPAGPR